MRDGPARTGKERHRSHAVRREIERFDTLLNQDAEQHARFLSLRGETNAEASRHETCSTCDRRPTEQGTGQ
jgi:hypothetical protein